MNCLTGGEHKYRVLLFHPEKVFKYMSLYFKIRFSDVVLIIVESRKVVE